MKTIENHFEGGGKAPHKRSKEQSNDTQKELINVRVLQHDLQDEIRIGVAFPIWNTPEEKDKVVLKTIDTYDEKLKWCGGFDEGAKKYFKRIAIVNADTLEVIRLIYFNELRERSNTNKL